ncbi:MAG: class I SAM-dependent methyltransferase [Candidatus Omnitrophota bacterium]|nr:MAG: class I SAM-dependent methyltransferase [Candidatus Omnitrophota bacterium]
MVFDKNFDLSAVRDDSYYIQARPEMLKYIPEDSGRILDVGCGAGLFAGRLKEKLKAEVWGVEIDKSAAALAQDRIDRVLVGDISKLQDELPKAYFDCIIFNDVLEHLVDPFGLLSKIKDKLDSNGAVVSSIPNVRFLRILKDLLLKKQWKYAECGILDKSHLRFFTRQSIIDMFGVLDYEILKIEGLSPRKTSWGFNLLSFLTLGNLSDTKYPKFACIAKPK